MVDDQIGRLAFTEDIAAGIKHLLFDASPYGRHKLTNDDQPRFWGDLATLVFSRLGTVPAVVRRVSSWE